MPQFLGVLADHRGPGEFGTHGKGSPRWLNRMTVSEAKRYMQEGHVAPSSMHPKIQACMDFLEGGGKQALITNPENIELASGGKTGTRIVPDTGKGDDEGL